MLSKFWYWLVANPVQVSLAGICLLEVLFIVYLVVDHRRFMRRLQAMDEDRDRQTQEWRARTTRERQEALMRAVPPEVDPPVVPPKPKSRAVRIRRVSAWERLLGDGPEPPKLSGKRKRPKSNG